ncbi:MAG: ATP-dependent Clp protease proteolytic subunit [Planctomycetes bacterium]|nr:ATP-dependent Clp protease proteolytic subunit [Planctomycetota bacterium]
MYQEEPIRSAQRAHVECPEEGEEGKGDKGALAAKLLKARTILIAKQVDKELMEKVTAQLLVLSHEDQAQPISVYVNSPGGDADSGFAIYDMMKFVKAPVHTICAGLCASAAVIIYLGGVKGQRLCLPNSRFLIHQPSTYAEGQASDIAITAKQILKIRDRYNQIVAAETGTAADKIMKDANRDFWLSAEEALEYGLVDRIVAAQGEIE